MADARAARRGSGSPGEPRRVAYAYLLPAFVLYAAFVLWPLIRGAWFSLYDWDGLGVGTWVGLDNYLDVVTDEALRESFVHALVLIVFYAVLPAVLGLLVAAVMTRARMRGLSFFRTVLFFPQVIAMVVVAIAWRRIYAPEGTLNDVLELVGLDGLTRAWLGDYATALPAVGFVGTWVGTGLCIVLFLAGMSRIPRDLYEAARLDGAGAVREFRAVTLPSLRGELAVALTLTVVAALRTFDLIYNTTRGGPGNSTSVPSYEVYHRAFELGRVGSACAVAVTLTAVIFGLSWLITRIGREPA